MEKEYYVFFTGGMTVGTEEWYNDILPENFATSYEEIVNEGKMMLASDAQIEFYKKHQDYDLYHLFYMLTLTEEEQQAKKEEENAQIKRKREINYKNNADPLYMAYVKNSALGNTEKANDYYNQWLNAVQKIKEENPYSL